MLISRASTRIAQISATGVNPVSAYMSRRIKMEPTLTENCVLYYAQHKSSKLRASFFQRFRAAAASKRRKPISN